MPLDLAQYQYPTGKDRNPVQKLIEDADNLGSKKSDGREKELSDICQDLFELHAQVRKKFPRKGDNEPRILKYPRFVNRSTNEEAPSFIFESILN